MAAVGSSRKGSSLRVWQLSGVPNTSETGVTVTTADYATAAFTTPPHAPQKGTSTLIDTNGNWLVDAFFQNGHLWVSANSGCIPASDTTTRSCMRGCRNLAGHSDGDAGPDFRRESQHGVHRDRADAQIAVAGSTQRRTGVESEPSEGQDEATQKHH
jgi:hypothetical protein